MAGKIGTSNLHWFARGMLGGLLLMAGVNAVSYFFRSNGLGSLLGETVPTSVEGLGFPFEVWRNGSFFNGMFVDYRAVGGNLLFALIPSALFGLIGVLGKSHFNRWVAEFEQREAIAQRLKFQFSMKSLLVLTTVAAVTVAAISNARGSGITLAFIYLLGPAVLIGIAMSPDRIRWEFRAILLTIIAAGMIGIAIATGAKLGLPFDKVLFGIFVCWVPQSVFVAFGITASMTAQAFLKNRQAGPT